MPRQLRAGHGQRRDRHRLHNIAVRPDARQQRLVAAVKELDARLAAQVAHRHREQYQGDGEDAADGGGDRDRVGHVVSAFGKLAAVP